MAEGKAITLGGGQSWPGPDYRGFETEDFIYLVDSKNAMAVEGITNLLIDPKDQTEKIMRILDMDAAIVIDKAAKTVVKAKKF